MAGMDEMDAMTELAKMAGLGDLAAVTGMPGIEDLTSMAGISGIDDITAMTGVQGLDDIAAMTGMPGIEEMTAAAAEIRSREEAAQKVLSEMVERYPALKGCIEDIEKAYDILVESYENGGKLLLCGSGGSASDALHITGELMKAFITKRKADEDFQKALTENAPAEDAAYLNAKLQGALPAVALVENSALATAVLNDISGEVITAQQVYGLGNPGDVLWAISTSGNSKGGCYAVETAQAKGMKTIGLTGSKGGRYKELCDCTIRVPETETYKVQEYHLPVYHAICRMLEIRFFGL